MGAIGTGYHSVSHRRILLSTHVLLHSGSLTTTNTRYPHLAIYYHTSCHLPLTRLPLACLPQTLTRAGTFSRLPFSCHLTAPTHRATAKRTSISSRRPSSQKRNRARPVGSLGLGRFTSCSSPTTAGRSVFLFRPLVFSSPRPAISPALARASDLRSPRPSFFPTGCAVVSEAARPAGRRLGLPRRPGAPSSRKRKPSLPRP